MLAKFDAIPTVHSMEEVSKGPDSCGWTSRLW